VDSQGGHRNTRLRSPSKVSINRLRRELNLYENLTVSVFHSLNLRWSRTYQSSCFDFRGRKEVILTQHPSGVRMEISMTRGWKSKRTHGWAMRLHATRFTFLELVQLIELALQAAKPRGMQSLPAKG
jgi:hypothetical protein